jgi:Rap1a immunity proteins
MRRTIRTMSCTGLALAFSAAFVPSAARAEFEREDFHIRSAQDLVDLCAVKNDDPLYSAAIHFCEGFIAGAWQYHQAQANGPKGVRLVCPPEPPPTRDEAVAMFITWSGTHTDRMVEPAVEALFRFMNEKYPCPAAASVTKGGS